MLVDKKSVPWIVFTGILLVIATVVYFPYAHSEVKGATGGSTMGLTYGIVGTAFMAFAMLLALKKRMRTTPILGRTYVWMQGHVWLSLVSYPLILYHAGFHWGQAWNITWVMMWIFTIVVISGIVGLWIQNVVPTKLLNDVLLETIYDEIDHIVKQLTEEADTIAANASAVEEEERTDTEGGGVATATPVGLLLTAKERLSDFYAAQVKSYMISPRGRRSVLTNATSSADAFDDIRRALPEFMRSDLDDLESIVDERRQLERQRSLHHWLHFWLLVHIPLSYALTVLAIVHIVAALRYR